MDVDEFIWEQTLDVLRAIFFSTMLICTFLFFYDVYKSDEIVTQLKMDNDTLSVVNFDLPSRYYILSDGTYCGNDVIEFCRIQGGK